MDHLVCDARSERGSLAGAASLEEAAEEIGFGTTAALQSVLKVTRLLLDLFGEDRPFFLG